MRTWWHRFLRWPRSLRIAAYVAIGVVILLVVSLVTAVALVRRPFPETSGDAAAGRPRRRGRGDPRRERHPAALRRQPRRPDAGPGFRARAGALLRDGRPPPRHRRPALGAVRRGRRSRPTSTSARWAGAGSPSRSSRCSSRRPGPRSTRTPTASTPTSPSARRAGSPSSTPCSVPAASTTGPSPGRPVDSLAWLKAMAWDLRGNMSDEIERVLALAEHSAREVAELYPPYPYDEHAPIVRQGAVVDGVFEQDATGRRHPPAAAAGVHRGRSATRSPVCSAASTGCRRCSAAATASAATAGSSTATTPRPASRCSPTTRTSASRLPGIWMQMGLHCRTVVGGLPARRRRLHLLRRPRRGHRPQRRHRLGVHEPRPRRHRPLPGEGPRRRVAVRRPERARCGPATETIEVAGGDDVALTVRSTGTARCSPTSPTSWRDVGEQAPADDGADRAATATRSRWRGPRSTRRRPPTRSWRSTAPPTGTSSARPPRRSRSPARTSSTPTARATSATRRPGRIPIRKSGNDGDCPAAGWRPDDDWTGDVRAVRRAAERARPRGGVHRHRQPGGHRPGLPLPPHRRLGPRLPLAADPRPARRRGRAVGRRAWPSCSSTTATRSRRRWCRTCSTSSCPRGYYADGQRLLRDWDFAQDADSAGGGVLQRGVAQPARADLPRRAARGAAGPTAASAGWR